MTRTKTEVWTPARALRVLRRHLGLTQQALAGELGLPSSYISLYERDKVPLPPTVLTALTDCLGILPLWMETGQGPCRAQDGELHPSQDPMPKRTYRTLRPRQGELLAAVIPPPAAQRSPVLLLREQVLRLRAVASLPTDDANFRSGLLKGWTPETASLVADGLESVAHKEIREPGYVLAYVELIDRLGLQHRMVGTLLHNLLRDLRRSPDGKAYLARHVHRKDAWQEVLLAQELTQLGHPYLGHPRAVVDALAAAGVKTLKDLVGETPKSLAERTGLQRRSLKPLLDYVATLLARPQLPRVEEILAAIPGSMGRKRPWGYYRERDRNPET